MTQGSICGCREKKTHNIYLHRKWGSPQPKCPLCADVHWKGQLPNMAANSTNGLVYDKAAQTQRVPIHCICDKRGLEMLAVRPLIRQSYILNRSFCLKKGRLYSSQRKLKVENWSQDEPQKPTPFPTVRPVRTPKSNAPISKSTHLVMQQAGNTGA